jgi:hypothetical protein
MIHPELPTASLSFETLYMQHWFTVKYDTEHEGHIRIMDVVYNGWLLDTGELRTADKVLWQFINDAAMNNCETHWQDYKEGIAA